MKTIPLGRPEQIDQWIHVDKNGPPPLNAPINFVYIGDELEDESGIEVTFGYRKKEGYVDLVHGEPDQLIPPYHIVLAYIIIPPWKVT
jgi:hypothetical protein